jgi:hypothetical protein
MWLLSNMGPRPVGMNACIERVVLSSLQVHLLYIFELEGVNLLEVLHQDPE